MIKNTKLGGMRRSRDVEMEESRTTAQEMSLFPSNVGKMREEHLENEKQNLRE